MKWSMVAVLVLWSSVAMSQTTPGLVAIRAAATVLARATHVDGTLVVTSPDRATLGLVEVTRSGPCSFTATPIEGQTVTFHFGRLTRRVRSANGQVEFEGAGATCVGPIGSAPTCYDGLLFDLPESLLPDTVRQVGAVMDACGAAAAT